MPANAPGQFRLSKIAIGASHVAAGNLFHACHSEENLDNSAMARVVCLDGGATAALPKRMAVARRQTGSRICLVGDS
ncbi:hypothetical protein L6R21_19465 [bacterium]|nr:hypothetical protein [bacterium]